MMGWDMLLIMQHSAVRYGIKGKFILSYNDDEFVRELYKDYHIEGISRNSNLTNKLNADTFDEVIIRNY